MDGISDWAVFIRVMCAEAYGMTVGTMVGRIPTVVILATADIRSPYPTTMY